MAGDLVLQYLPTLTQDYLSYSALKTYTPRNSTLATYNYKGGALTQVYIHGNSNMKVSRDGKDVGKSFRVDRVWRFWMASLTPGPAEDRGAYVQQMKWKVDSAEKPLGEFHDSPYIGPAARQINTVRFLAEWTVGIRDINADLVLTAGGVYFIIVTDLSATQYMIRMSAAIKLTEAEFAAARHLSNVQSPLSLAAPWKTEVDFSSADWAARHNSWQDWAAYNQQLPIATE